MRINLFTGKSLQFRYLLIIVFAMTVPALMVGAFLYYFIFTVTAEQIGIPEAIAVNLIPAVNKINFMLITGLVPLFALLLLWGSILSHRFCGPLERIEKDFDKILEGNFALRFKVRDKDDIKPILDKLNKILDKLTVKTK